jgi:hypothetical protein
MLKAEIKEVYEIAKEIAKKEIALALKARDALKALKHEDHPDKKEVKKNA